MEVIIFIIAYGLMRRRKNDHKSELLVGTLDTQKQIKCVNIYLNDLKICICICSLFASVTSIHISKI